ncbi:MAG: type II secretion system F family protein [Verrucomicrobiota bacterium]
MPTFAYSARTKDGQTVEAELTASGRREALRALSSRGLTPIHLSEQGLVAAAPKTPAARTGSRAVATAETAATTGAVKLRRKHQLEFLSSLHDLTSGGLSAGEAVRMLAARVKDPAMREISGGLWERISEGATLSRAMAAYPQVFTENSINLVQAGEATGNLNEVFVRLIAHLTEQRELQRTLAASLAYPVFLALVAGGVVLFFLFFLLPRLEGLFKSLKGEMPTSTKLLIGLSGFALKYGIFVVAAALIIAVIAWRWRNSEEGRKISDGWLIRLPVFGPFFVARTVLAFTQNLSVLLENGITTAEALRMTEKQVGNRVHRAAFTEATDHVLEGEALSKALTRTGCFPDLVLDQLAVGEANGNLVPGLRKVANGFQRMLSTQLKLFTSVIGSAVLLAVFAFVGFIAYAIVQAVFSMSAAIKM